MNIQVKVISEALPAAKNKTITIDYDDTTGLCNGSNAANWNNIIEFSGSPGNWSPSFKNPNFAEIWEFVV
jgi:hypothetical protein